MSKQLVNAARYLDAVHDIAVDETHPMLDKIIRKHTVALDDRQLASYWSAYIKEIDVTFDTQAVQNANDIVQNADSSEGAAVYYRGVEQKVDSSKINSRFSGAVKYRGATEQQSVAEEAKPTRRNKPVAMYRGRIVE